jgi:octaprenyl-diphosphate synthase
MSKSLDSIKAPVAREMDEFEHKFRNVHENPRDAVRQDYDLYCKAQGQTNAAVVCVFKCWRHGYNKRVNLYRGAALIELLHTATLVHDDVVDDSDYRRGFFSVNALWKNKIAVLVGDFLLSRGMALSLENNEFDLLRIVNTLRCRK